MLGSLVVAQMDGMAYEGMEGPATQAHGALERRKRRGAKGSAVVRWERYRAPKRGGAVRAYAVRY